MPKTPNKKIRNVGINKFRQNRCSPCKNARKTKGGKRLLNIVGNARYQTVEEKIEKAVVGLLKRRGYDNFSIKDICIDAEINRSTFYAHYQDINDFMIKFEGKLAKQMQSIWKPKDTKTGFCKDTFVEFFAFIKEHKHFYQAFLKSNTPSFLATDMLKRQKELFRLISMRNNLNYTEAQMDYHLHYFGGGLKAISGRWIQNDCKETPGEMAQIIFDEYTNRG